MNLKLTPFSKAEKKRKYRLKKFKERGNPFAFLTQVSQSKVNSKIKYKFGLIDKEGKLFWFFYGRATCRNRNEAIRTYVSLLLYCQENNLGEPFAFKD